MSKIIIGVPGYKIGEKTFSYGVGANHLEYIASFEGVSPRILMPDEEIAKIDMLYLPGGADLFPGSYGATPGFKTTNPDLFKQFFYDYKLQNYIGKIPIFAVCLGFQQLAVKLGASLIQNLLGHPQSNERGEGAHEITLSETAKMLIGNPKKYEVNSHHHQGVSMANLPKEFIPLAYYGEKKNAILEAYTHEKYAVYAVQWHPEEYYDLLAEEMFKIAINSIQK